MKTNLKNLLPFESTTIKLTFDKSRGYYEMVPVSWIAGEGWRLMDSSDGLYQTVTSGKFTRLERSIEKALNRGETSGVLVENESEWVVAESTWIHTPEEDV